MARRKMLAAEEGVANRVAKLAERRGLTVFQTVNDMLGQALRVEEMGVPLSDLVDRRGVLERARSMGFTFTIERLLYDMVEMANSRARKQVSDAWLETGRWYGKYFTSKGKDGLREFREAMELLTFGTPEFELREEKNGGLHVSCVGERFTQGYSEMFSLFIEGVLEAFQYRPTSREATKGIVRLAFEKTG